MSTRSSVRRRLAAAACAPVLLVSFAACGSDDGDGKAADTSGSSSAAPSDLQSGDTVSADEFADLISTALDKATTAHMSMSMDMGSQGSMDAEGDADYTTDPISMTMTMTIAGTGSSNEKIDMVMVDNVMYMKLPAGAGAGAGDKYWALDLADADNLPAGMGDLLDQMDPMKSMEQFGDALDSVTYQGTEDVDGESLEKYDVSVDTSALPQLSQMSQQGMDLPKTVDYELYLDSDGLMRRMETGFQIMGQQMDITVGLDDWGQPVDITAPPKSQTTSFPGTQTAG